jgi:hypothetical protein
MSGLAGETFTGVAAHNIRDLQQSLPSILSILIAFDFSLGRAGEDDATADDEAPGAKRQRKGQISVLMVCLDNVSRGPAAALSFVAKAEAAGISDRFYVDSCGIGAGKAVWLPFDLTHTRVRARGAHDARAGNPLETNSPVPMRPKLTKSDARPRPDDTALVPRGLADPDGRARLERGGGARGGEAGLHPRGRFAPPQEGRPAGRAPKPPTLAPQVRAHT